MIVVCKQFDVPCGIKNVFRRECLAHLRACLEAKGVLCSYSVGLDFHLALALFSGAENIERSADLIAHTGCAYTHAAIGVCGVFVW